MNIVPRDLKMVAVTVIVDCVRYTRFVNIPRDTVPRFTMAQLNSMFPALAALQRGDTWSYG